MNSRLETPAQCMPARPYVSGVSGLGHGSDATRSTYRANWLAYLTDDPEDGYSICDWDANIWDKREWLKGVGMAMTPQPKRRYEILELT